MCPNSAPRPCRAQAQTQRYNRVCESLSWVSSRKKVRETCQTQLTFSDSLSALPSYIVSDIFSIPLLGEFTPREETIRHGTNLEFCYFGQMKASLDEEKTVQKNVSEGEM